MFLYRQIHLHQQLFCNTEYFASATWLAQSAASGAASDAVVQTVTPRRPPTARWRRPASETAPSTAAVTCRVRAC